MTKNKTSYFGAIIIDDPQFKNFNSIPIIKIKENEDKTLTYFLEKREECNEEEIMKYGVKTKRVLKWDIMDSIYFRELIIFENNKRAFMIEYTDDGEILKTKVFLHKSNAEKFIEEKLKGKIET